MGSPGCGRQGSRARSQVFVLSHAQQQPGIFKVKPLQIIFCSAATTMFSDGYWWFKNIHI